MIEFHTGWSVGSSYRIGEHLPVSNQPFVAGSGILWVFLTFDPAEFWKWSLFWGRYFPMGGNTPLTCFLGGARAKHHICLEWCSIGWILRWEDVPKQHHWYNFPWFPQKTYWSANVFCGNGESLANVVFFAKNGRFESKRIFPQRPM